MNIPCQNSWLQRWLEAYGEETTEKILKDFLEEKPLTVRCRTYLNSQEAICEKPD